MLLAMHRPVTGVEPKKAPSRESHGHQELSGVKKVIVVFFRPKRAAQVVPPMNCGAGDLRSFNTRRTNYGRAEQQRCHPEESAHCAPFALLRAEDEGSAFRWDKAMAEGSFVGQAFRPDNRIEQNRGFSP